MKIEDLRLEETRSGSRAEARIVWEDSDRPPFRAHFEWEGVAAAGREADANPFLTAAFIPAMRDGERRMRIEAPGVCPVLRENLRLAAERLGQWYGPRRIPEIEAPGGLRRREPEGPAAFFLSGGVDSLHSLFHNRSTRIPDDEGFFREAVHFLGMALFEEEPSEAGRNLAERGLRSAGRIAAGCGLTLRPVRSNVARLSGNHLFWATHTQGAMLASAAIGLPIRSASLAASWDLRFFPPWGSHPDLDPFYSTSAVEMRHVGAEFTRLEKIRSLAGRPLALENMIVCHGGPLPPGELNCGRCEKCVRTMAELLVAGALDGSTAFPVRRVTPEAVDAIAPTQLRTERFWTDLLEPLETLGRADLSRAVGDFLDRARRQRSWEDDRGWRGHLRRLDRSLLGGVLGRLRARRRR